MANGDNAIRNDDAFQAGAAAKGVIADGSCSFRNGDVFHQFVVEKQIAGIIHRVAGRISDIAADGAEGYADPGFEAFCIYAFQTGAVVKGGCSYADQAFRNTDGFQAGAVVKALPADGGHAILDHKILNGCAVR